MALKNGAGCRLPSAGSVGLALLLIVACSRSSPEAVEAKQNSENNHRPVAIAEPPRCTPGWQEVDEGIEYRAINCSGDGSEFDLHAVRLDPAKWRLDAVKTGPAAVNEVARQTGAKFAINANFFDPENRPLGLIVNGGKELQSPHPVEWESIFLVHQDGTPKIVLPPRWPGEKAKTRTAVQAGPRVVIRGERTRVVPGDPGWRSGVCIQDPTSVVFFVTPPSRLMTAVEAGEIVHRELECRDAMLFDGGPSAQMYLERAEGSVIIKGDDVPVFLTAKAR